MSLHNKFWILRQNYGEITNQTNMRDLIMTKKIVTCPWGGWGLQKERIINKVYNEEHPDRSSRGQDRKFVEEINIGDIILIPFSKEETCIIARIVSNTDEIDTGLFWKETSGKIIIGGEGEQFKPIGRYIEIINPNFPKPNNLGQLTLCKMNNQLINIL